MVKLAMARMWKRGIFSDGAVIPWSVIHDEVVMQIKTTELNRLVPVIASIVTSNYADIVIPMTTDPEVGKNFGSLKEFSI